MKKRNVTGPDTTFLNSVEVCDPKERICLHLRTDFPGLTNALPG